MKYLTWWILAAVIAAYGLVVSVVPFEGPVAVTIHFCRLAATTASWIIYIQIIPLMFQEIPAPRRDYLLASINFFLLSLIAFSHLNAAGRLFGVDTSVFTSYIAGLFSIFAIIAAVLALKAPDTGGIRPKVIAVIIAIIWTGGFAFFDPVFR